MKAFKVLNNESGMMAMIGAMIFTVAITTTLSTFYVYTINQAKYHARIKEAYQLINIMESFAAATRKAYDMGMSAAAQGANCPSTGAAPIAVGGGTTSFYCPPAGETCFHREDTNEEYCSSISFANNETVIQKKKSYAEIKTDSFIKKWRNGLNHFYLSPGIKDKIIDTSTMAYVMQKPRILDWLTATAQANEIVSAGGKETPIESDGKEEAGEVTIGGGKEVSCEVNPNQDSCGTTKNPDTQNPITVSSSYINCAQNLICTPNAGGQGPTGGTREVGTTPGIGGSGFQQNAGANGNNGIGGNAGGCIQMTTAQAANYCSNCNASGQLCPEVGGEGISVRRGGNDVREPLPIRQRFSIIM